jgi:hypothetical protein
MNERTIILICLEVVSVLLIIRLWFRGGMSLGERLLLTILLLLPLLGPVFYFVIVNNPKDHGEDPGSGNWGT